MTPTNEPDLRDDDVGSYDPPNDDGPLKLETRPPDELSVKDDPAEATAMAAKIDEAPYIAALAKAAHVYMNPTAAASPPTNSQIQDATAFWAMAKAIDQIMKDYGTALGSAQTAAREDFTKRAEIERKQAAEERTADAERKARLALRAGTQVETTQSAPAPATAPAAPSGVSQATPAPAPQTAIPPQPASEPLPL